MSLASKIACVALCLAPLWCRAAESIGLVTIMDGDGFVIRKTEKIQLKPGLKLFAQDLLESAAQSHLLRIELAAGGVYDLGPSTLAMVRPGLSGASGKAVPLYLLKGWLKVSGAAGAGAGTTLVLAERMEVLQVPGSAVIAVQPNAFQIFAESGAVSVVDKRTARTAAPTTLLSGSLYSGNQADKAVVSTRAPGAFIQSVPKGFQESIPALADNFKSRAEPALKHLGDISYQDASPWLAAETALRKLLLPLWKNQLPADLRSGLIAHLEANPEWRNILFPEKDATRQAPSAAAN